MFPYPPVVSKAAARTSIGLHTNTAHLTPPNPTAKETLQEQMPGKQLGDLGWNRVLGQVGKGWERSRVRSCGRPNPATAPAAVPAQLLSLPAPFSLLCHSLLFPALALPRIFSPASHLSRQVLQRQLCRSVLRNL